MTSNTLEEFQKAVDKFFDEHQEDLENIHIALQAKFYQDVWDIIMKRMKENGDEVLQHEAN